MNVMNLIHEICLTKNRINNIPKWKFIVKKKQKEKLNNLILEFLNLDIFVASENAISFFISINRNTIYNIDSNLKYDDSYLNIQLSDNNYVTHITYYPKSNRFEIENDHVAYTIYRNTKSSKHIKSIWEPLTDKIKEKYINIIIQIAESIAINTNNNLLR